MNKLKNEKSLYLLQHASNPVNWYPWSQEAFDIAKKDDKPIILSIGYSACHWCHVMAHESFEDTQTAELMNQYFISIKVDKEERPDLDKVYQMSQTIITGKTGGWPLTVFMSPNKFPFFAGTYFPSEEKYGLPSFKNILERVSKFYKTQKTDIENQNTTILEIFNNLGKKNISKGVVSQDLIDKTKADLFNSIDKVHGGFGSAPKFPHSYSLTFLLNNINLNDKTILEHISHTLERMCFGGIYDQLEGGFFRYSVDELWMVPHFEKMLYDNGPLVEVLCNAYRQTANPLFLKKIQQTSNWLINKMQDSNGGFYSTIDADSENVEGKYYVWEKKELESILSKEEFGIIENSYFVNNKPNFDGKYHFHTTKNSKDYFLKNKIKIDKINEKLLTIRSKRIEPNIDKKILVSWNALAIIGLINAYKLTDDTKFFNSLKKCFTFIRKNLWKNEKLFSCFNKEPCFSGYLDDYAFLLKAVIELLKVEWNSEDFYFAKKLADTIIINFQNNESGGFYFTSNDHEKLIYRPQTYMDESLPAGNSFVVESLLELGYLEGNKVYIDAAEKTVVAASDSINRSNTSHSSLLTASTALIKPKIITLIRCAKSEVKPYKRRLFSLNKRNYSCYFIDNEEENIPKELCAKKSIGVFTAYVCEGYKCLEPIDNFEEVLKKYS